MEFHSRQTDGLQSNAYGAKKNASAAGTVMTADVTRETLLAIFTGVKSDLDNEQDAAKKGKLDQYVNDMVTYLNDAFRAMKVDTVEARAAFLAHAFIESDQFRRFTETQKATQNYERNPGNVTLDKGYLKGLGDKEIAQDAKHKADPSEAKGQNWYRAGGSVNPNGNFEFLGRGPIQVTHRDQYVETIAVLEHMSEQWAADAQSAQDPAKKTEAEAMAKKCGDAAVAIKADPNAAARPEHTLLFSAATMKRAGGDVSSSNVKAGKKWDGTDGASGWVAGGKQDPNSPQGKALIEKSRVYADAIRILGQQPQGPAAAAPPPAPAAADAPAPGTAPEKQPPAGATEPGAAPGTLENTEALD